ncbi:MAG: HAD family phosphatase, partial [Mesorhizobium sp.]
MMRIPKLVIFDCDGVLVDTENLANRRLAEWLTAAGYPASFEHCRKNFSGRVHGFDELPDIGDGFDAMRE